MKKPALPQQITKQGITATIRRVLKRGYESFRVEYAVQGKRKQVWRSDYQEARRLADNVIESIANGDHGVLEFAGYRSPGVSAGSRDPETRRGDP